MIDADGAFARYEAIRPRLPRAEFADGPTHADNLSAAVAGLDGVVLDAFGVLNVGETPIPGAVDRIAALRAAGLGVCVLTNAASYPRETALAKYHRLGFDFSADEVVSSRDVAAARLEAIAADALWAGIGAGGDDFADIPAEVGDLLADDQLWEGADAFLFLSSLRWDSALQDRLVRALSDAPRPLVVANPDLVAPREDGLTIEPGWWGHDLQDRTGLAPGFFGKPYGAAFAEAARRLGGGRLAMVGDTLHTDILGGRGAGMTAVLVSDHGLFAGQPVAPFIARSGIVPDVIVPAI